MKYNDLSFGQAEAVFNKLGGIEGVKNFLSGKTKVVLDEKNPFDVWKTISLGTFNTVDQFRELLKNNGLRLTDYGNFILRNTEFTLPSKNEIHLVNVSVADLGFENDAHYEDICAEAQKHGLELCSNEVGPQLRLQYKNQPKGECLHIAMSPVNASICGPSIFVIERDDKLFLNDLSLHGKGCTSDDLWDNNQHFIFCVRK